jgi:hypothetical protein
MKRNLTNVGYATCPSNLLLQSKPQYTVQVDGGVQNFLKGVPSANETICTLSKSQIRTAPTNPSFQIGF